MKVKRKSWIWWLTFPFAHNNWTTIWNTIYGPREDCPYETIRHEEVHSAQQHRWGWALLPVWIFCYVFLLPLFWNPFRYKWEYEAFVEGSWYSDEQTRKILRSYRYGWLI